MMLGAEMLSVVPREGAWRGHFCCSGCALPPGQLHAQQALIVISLFAFFVKPEVLFNFFRLVKTGTNISLSYKGKGSIT